MFTGSADQHPVTEVGGSVDTFDILDPADPALGELGQLGELDTSWTTEAACKGRTSLFFGIAGERPERRIRRERTARGVCDGCSVVAPCRERARQGRENGFWGGESEEERAAAGFPPRSISRRSVQQASSVRAEAS
jgi:WhiB family redox-sensing transcriptional regulator